MLMQLDTVTDLRHERLQLTAWALGSTAVVLLYGSQCEAVDREYMQITNPPST